MNAWWAIGGAFILGYIARWVALCVGLTGRSADQIIREARDQGPAPMTYHWRLPAADPDGPPEYEPEDEEAQRIAEMFAEAAAEEDRQHD